MMQDNGVPRDMVCRGLMLKLHREGVIELPPVLYVPLAERGQPAAVCVDRRPLHEIS